MQLSITVTLSGVQTTFVPHAAINLRQEASLCNVFWMERSQTFPVQSAGQIESKTQFMCFKIRSKYI